MSRINKQLFHGFAGRVGVARGDCERIGVESGDTRRVGVGMNVGDGPGVTVGSGAEVIGIYVPDK